MKAQGICYRVKPAFVFGSDTTYEHNREVEIPITSETYINPIQVDWGDGTVESYSSGTYLSHTYDTDDDDAEYTIRITSASGKLPQLVFGESIVSIGSHPKARLSLKKFEYANSDNYKNTTKVINSGEYFAWCLNLESVCNGIYRHGTQITSTLATFQTCRSITQCLYDKMFEHCTSLSDIRGLFQISIGTAPECYDKIPVIPSSVTRMSYAFWYCSHLTGPLPTIPSGVTDLTSTFRGCSGLTGSIPTGLFDNNPDVTNFSYTFSGCSGLTGSIPDGLFDNNPNVTNFNNTFSGCSGLTGSIPDGLFDNNPDVTTFDSTFSGCSGLTGSIPTGLFDNCSDVTTFAYTFYGCSGLTGSIPDGLFDNNPDVTSFGNTFRGCSGLTGSIPTGLFDNCPDVTNFNCIFYNCSGLTGLIPTGIFDNNTATVEAIGCFSGCTGITGFDNGIIDNLQLLSKIGSSWYGDGMFFNCTGLTQAAPDWWNTRTDITDHQYTFYNCTNMSNYASIPSGWK